MNLGPIGSLYLAQPSALHLVLHSALLSARRMFRPLAHESPGRRKGNTIPGPSARIDNHGTFRDYIWVDCDKAKSAMHLGAASTNILDKEETSRITRKRR
jgi:hypothetical protein